MQDGSPWPGNNVRDHPGMIQVGLYSHWCFTKCWYSLSLSSSYLKALFISPEPKDCSTSFTSNFSKLCVNRCSLAKVVVMMLKEMSCLALFMSQEKRGQAITIIRRLVP